ncbi:hypothetical protein O3M35_010794 [Rhynocoris fuscipes]|uniref:Uncharacterized protein n=1 Tax=Rhynocoris fuscipes TaxID=488301 RepID=A0AAW1D2N6_9HEMI
MSSEFDDEDSYGVVGLRCCQLPQFVQLIAYIPSFVFIIAYVLCVRQALLVDLPHRGRISFIIKVVLGAFFFGQSYEVWVRIIRAVNSIVDHYFSDQLYKQYLNIECETWIIPKPEIIKLSLCFLLSTVPILVWYIVYKQQQRFRFMWMDLRRRYRGELGSGRYYLSRPCRALEAPNTISEPVILRKTRSDFDFVTATKHTHNFRHSKSF